MKNKVTLISSIIFIFIAATLMGFSFVPPPNGETQVVGMSTEEEQPNTAGTCHAYTSCGNGYSISCVATGQGCSWYVEPFSYVQCTGFIGGFWQTAYRSCY